MPLVHYLQFLCFFRHAPPLPPLLLIPHPHRLPDPFFFFSLFSLCAPGVCAPPPVIFDEIEKVSEGREFVPYIFFFFCISPLSLSDTALSQRHNSTCPLKREEHTRPFKKAFVDGDCDTP